MLGGLFPIRDTARTNISSSETRCGQLFAKGLIMANAMLYAVELVNKANMLPYNMTLGYSIRDTCNNLNVALKSAVKFVAARKTKTRAVDKKTYDHTIPADKDVTTKNPLSENQLSHGSLVAVVGAGGSELSIAVNNLLSVYDIPQIAYASTSTVLSDKIRYRTFLRLTPPDNLQALALARLVAHFGWKYVSVLYSDDNYGRPLQEVFQDKAEQYGVCLANKITLPYRATRQTIEEKLRKIQRTPKSKVILLFASEFDARNVLKAVKRLDIRNKVWIASDSWSSSLNVINDYLPWTKLTLGSTLRHRHATGLMENLKRLLQKNQELFPNDTVESSSFPSSWPSSRKLNFDLKSSLAMAENVVNCVYAAAQSITLFCRNQESAFLGRRKNVTDAELKRNCLQLIRPRELLKYLFNSSLKGFNNNTIAISESGDPHGVYDFLNVYFNLSKDFKSNLTTVGFYDSLSNKVRLNDSALYWTLANENVPQSKCSEPCIPGTVVVTTDRKACCWDCQRCPRGHMSNKSMASYCTPCPDGHDSNDENTACIYVPLLHIEFSNPWSIMISLLCVISCLFTLVALTLFVKHRSSPVVRSTCQELSFPLLITLAAAFLLPLIDIGQPTNEKCAVSAFSFSILFNVILTLVLATISRTVMVFEARSSSFFHKKIFLTRRFHLGLVLVSLLVQFTICLLWFLLDPPHATRSEVFVPSFKRYVFCKQGSEWPLISLSYLALLSLISTGLAHRSRNLPENYNNAKFIAFAMFTFNLVGFTFLGAYHGTSNEGHRPLILRSFAIIMSGLCILLMIFGPKIYVILFRPELNNLRTFRKMTMQHVLRTSSVSASVSLKCVGDLQGTVCVMESNFQQKATQTFKQRTRDAATQTDANSTSPHNIRRGSFQKLLRHFSLERKEDNDETSKRRKERAETSDGLLMNIISEKPEGFIASTTNTHQCLTEDKSILWPLNGNGSTDLAHPKLILPPAREGTDFVPDKKHEKGGVETSGLDLPHNEWPEWGALKTSEMI